MRRILALIVCVLSLIPVLPLEAAAPRILHVIWDIGENALYCKARGRMCSFDAFVADGDRTWNPPAGPGYPGYVRIYPGDAILRAGDRVAVHVMNYNRVSHSPSSLTSTPVPEEIPALAALLATAASLVSGGSILSPPLVVEALPEREIESGPDAADCRDFASLAGCGNTIAAKIRALEPAAGVAKRLNVEVKKVTSALTKFPGQAWDDYRDDVVRCKLVRTVDQALSSVGSVSVFGDSVGGNCTHRPRSLEELDERIGDLKPAREKAGQAARLLQDATRTYRLHTDDVGSDLRAKLDSRLDGLRRALGEILTSFAELDRDRKHVDEVLARFAQQLDTRAVAYSKVLSGGTAGGVVVLEQSFNATTPTHPRSSNFVATVGVRRSRPVAFASAGLLATLESFDFQQASARQEVVDGTPQLRLEIAPTRKYKSPAPVLLTHVTLPVLAEHGVYGTLGTSLDRNFANNILLGGSYYVAPWRMVLTVGKMRARGAIDEDLQALIDDFSLPSGYAVPGTNPGLLGSTDDSHWRWFVSITFRPF